MKLDLIEINKLSPPGLWDLGILSAFISTLLQVSTSGAGHMYVRMAERYRLQLRERVLENLNMRIKAWVMLCPKRIAWVRHIIGEAAVKRWRKNRLADYALSKYFGDWKTKFPDGFARRNIKVSREYAGASTRQCRPYKWKFFALVKIENVYGFLYGRPAPDLESEDMRAAYLKLWGVDIADTDGSAKWQQARAPRVLKPVEFTPYELVAEENTNEVVLKVDAKPSKVRKILHQPDDPKRLETNEVQVPEVDKPP